MVVVKAVELYGEHIRVLAIRENGEVRVEITELTDPLYEKPVVLIVNESELHSEVEKLIDEIAQLLRRAVLELTRREVQ